MFQSSWSPEDKQAIERIAKKLDINLDANDLAGPDATFTSCVGRTSEKLATVVLGLVVHKFAPGLAGRITVGLDDCPTPRYGKHVEGAGVHHNPTPGPADGEWLYGHRPTQSVGARVAGVAGHPRAPGV